MRKTYPATLESLKAIAEDLEIFCEENGVDAKTSFALNLCLDELFTNSASYGCNLDPKKSVEISAKVANGEIFAEISDTARAFNPLSEVTDPNIVSDVDSRSIGGLGVFLVKKNMDEVSYKREGGKNVVSMRRKIAGGEDSK
jgi:anti-sigma regulatory factor (Ser/Thr protein kinase)